MRYLILVVLLAASHLPANAADSRGRPMAEMMGDCSNYATDLRREFRLWTQPPAELRAVPAGDVFAGALRPDRRTSVALLSADRVRFAVQPSENRMAADRFGGTVRISPLPAGVWRVSASRGVWIDIATGGALVEAPNFEMQTKCSTIFKTVTFRVPPKADLVLQLNGSPAATVDILLTRSE
jgi:hypothetical protein